MEQKWLKLVLANEWLYPCWLELNLLFQWVALSLLARTCFSLRRDLSWSWSPKLLHFMYCALQFLFFLPKWDLWPKHLTSWGGLCGSCFSLLHRLGFMTHIPFPLFIGCSPNNSHIYTKQTLDGIRVGPPTRPIR